MRKSTDIRHGRHCVFALHAHLVFVTKYRRAVFDVAMLECLRGVFGGVCEKFGVQLVEVNGELDHVHLLVNYAPQLSLSVLVNSLKGASSRVLRREIPRARSLYCQRVLWSPSYFVASCGGAPLLVLKQYIQNQQNP